MKAVIPSKPLSDAMKTITKALAPSSASLPALTHVLVDADGSLHLTATDLEVCLQVPVAGVVERGGAAVVPGRILANTVANVAGPVTLESNGRSLVVSARGTQAALPCLDPADFPAVAAGEPAPLAVLPAAELVEAARHVASAADRGSPRAFVSGVWLRFGEGEPDVTVLAAEQEIHNLLQAIASGTYGATVYAFVDEKERRVTHLKTELAMLPSPGSVPRVDFSQADALVEQFRQGVFELGRSELRGLFKGLGVSVTLWHDKAEAQFDWPPLRMLLPLHELHDWMYPQRSIAPTWKDCVRRSWPATMRSLWRCSYCPHPFTDPRPPSSPAARRDGVAGTGARA